MGVEKRKTNRFFSLMLTFAMLLAVAVFGSVLTACGHEHTFEEAWTIDEAYHYHKATCEHSEEVDGKEIEAGDTIDLTACGEFVHIKVLLVKEAAMS